MSAVRVFDLHGSVTAGFVMAGDPLTGTPISAGPIGLWRARLTRIDDRPAFLTLARDDVDTATDWIARGAVECDGIAGIWSSRAPSGVALRQAMGQAIEGSLLRAGTTLAFLGDPAGCRVGAAVAIDEPRAYPVEVCMDKSSHVAAVRLNLTRQS